jgi:hypothetical protein
MCSQDCYPLPVLRTRLAPALSFAAYALIFPMQGHALVECFCVKFEFGFTLLGRPRPQSSSNFA